MGDGAAHVQAARLFVQANLCAGSQSIAGSHVRPEDQPPGFIYLRTRFVRVQSPQTTSNALASHLYNL